MFLWSKKNQKKLKEQRSAQSRTKIFVNQKKNVRFAISDVCDRQTLRHNRVIFEFVFILT